ncbi:EamA family transporter RarD [Luminiphilus sp.]|nr:EamA family transporter RarD [Luminiphilus sp.]MDA7840296.1 EamA family transporter RarD [Luminiphilus sp.]MDA8658677.1 EamA family transporter RarD [Luminiphilus sp.]MDA9848100.1 EamA family transporter RarD [Luminiphilus sp.]MDB2352001.1 EamA family transporter RarD [Luminiphilus sp.]
MTTSVSQNRLGILLALIANSVWGCAALYWIQTKPVPPLDVLAHRGVWTLPAVLLVLLAFGRFRSTLSLLKEWHTLKFTALAALLISINWGVFLFAVTNGRATEASLGYFMLPILTAMAGVIVFREHPTRPQQVAMVLAVLAVAVQLVAAGTLPVVSLTLSISFATYSVIRKYIRADAIQGLFMESLFLMPVGATWLLLHQGGGLFEYGLRTDLFLLGAGALTAVPLLTHVASARILSMSTVGLFSYLGPSLQLVVAQTILGESITPVTLASFLIVWCGLAFILFDNFRKLRQQRKNRRLSSDDASR